MFDKGIVFRTQTTQIHNTYDIIIRQKFLF